MTPLTQTPESSQIAAFGYDAPSQVLSIMFRRSAVRYDYASVPPEVAKQFADAKSKGQVFTALIRDKFSFEKVVTEAA